ncbi:unnamed protein product [Brugia timori]|uniref:Uncharacterized protein n=1 Tax=Brugia timori TaxID=42155 RepID=A0A0R3QB36_9BILA|nr:unnamed protein product [Brugia timori]
MIGRKMSESGSLGTSSTGSDATTDPFSQLLASMARPIPCVTELEELHYIDCEFPDWKISENKMNKKFYLFHFVPCFFFFFSV